MGLPWNLRRLKKHEFMHRNADKSHAVHNSWQYAELRALVVIPRQLRSDDGVSHEYCAG